MLFALPGSAATPASGTLTDVSGFLTYTAGPFTVANLTPVPQVDTGPRCNANTNPCDNFALTVTLPSGYHAAHPNAAVKFTLIWGDTGSGQSDYDLYVYKGTVTTTDGSQPADAQSAGGNNPEVATFSPLADGSQQFSVNRTVHTHRRIVNVKSMLPGARSAVHRLVVQIRRVQACRATRTFMRLRVPQPKALRRIQYRFDPKTKRIMTMNLGPIWRLTPGEVQLPTRPECCEALWEDKSAVSTSRSRPILWTDQKTGRTFATNNTEGANFVYAYTDAAAPSDGDVWVEAGASPPNGGADHETIGSGPYPWSRACLTHSRTP